MALDNIAQDRHTDIHERSEGIVDGCGKKHMRLMTIILSAVLVITSGITAWGVSEGKSERLRMEKVVELAIEKIHIEADMSEKDFDVRLRMIEQSDAVNTERFRAIQSDIAEIKRSLHSGKGVSVALDEYRIEHKGN